jgi:hypothetical protein
VIQRRGLERGRKSTVEGQMVELNLSWAKVVESGGSTDHQRMSRRSQARVKMAAVSDRFVEVSRLEEEAKKLREANVRFLKTCERDIVRRDDCPFSTSSLSLFLSFSLSLSPPPPRKRFPPMTCVCVFVCACVCVCCVCVCAGAY